MLKKFNYFDCLLTLYFAKFHKCKEHSFQDDYKAVSKFNEKEKQAYIILHSCIYPWITAIIVATEPRRIIWVETKANRASPQPIKIELN